MKLEKVSSKSQKSKGERLGWKSKGDEVIHLEVRLNKVVKLSNSNTIKIDSQNFLIP